MNIKEINISGKVYNVDGKIYAVDNDTSVGYDFYDYDHVIAFLTEKSESVNDEVYKMFKTDKKYYDLWNYRKVADWIEECIDEEDIEKTLEELKEDLMGTYAVIYYNDRIEFEYIDSIKSLENCLETSDPFMFLGGSSEEEIMDYMRLCEGIQEGNFYVVGKYNNKLELETCIDAIESNNEKDAIKKAIEYLN